MKQTFSKTWKSSKQPRKQRKYRANAPWNIRRKMMSVNLNKELRKKYEKRNVPVRKGDVVKILRGKFKKKQGKVTEVDYGSLRVVIEGIQVKKQEGSKVNVKQQPSNLQIIEINMDDKKRMKALGVKIEGVKKEEGKTTNKKGKSEKKINEVKSDVGGAGTEKGKEINKVKSGGVDSGKENKGGKK